jgi:hypothetical protein
MTKTLPAASKLPLLLLLLLSPSIGFATQDAPVSEEKAPATGTQEAPESTQVPPEATQVQPREPESTAEPFTRAPLAVRLLSETAFGGLGVVGGWFVGSAIGSAVCPTPVNPGAGACIGEFVYGGIAGAALALPLGVWLGGNIATGTGSLVSTYLGGLVGTAVGGMLAILGGNNGVLIAIGVALPLVGSILGYETLTVGLKQNMNRGGTRLQPLLSVSPHGGFLGLGGRF